MISELLSLFYPRLCAACKNPLVKNEKTICAPCMMDLPYTNFHRYRDNPIEKIFWGRTPVRFATALCYFEQAGRVQELLHELKYKGNQEVGLILGRELGKQLLETKEIDKVDLILPVPLHPRKERMRGYNQALPIAEGIAEIINSRVQPEAAKRVAFTQTQTKRNRYNRFENVNEIFRVADNASVYGKHVLIVDDVITTGATIESCSNAILKVEDTKVSVATLACA